MYIYNTCVVIAQRKNNAFVKHPDGDALQRALLTGIYDGDSYPEYKGKKVTQSWLAEILGVSRAALSQHKKKLLNETSEAQTIIQHEQQRIKTEIVKRVVNPDDLPQLTEEISMYHRMMVAKAAHFVDQIESDPDKSEDVVWRKLWLDAMKETRSAMFQS